MSVPLECSWIECWPALLGDAAASDERARFERHLESCPACQARLDGPEACGEPLLQLARQVGDPTAAPVDSTLTQVLERLHEVRSPVRTAEGADLYFLGPAEQAGDLGTLGAYQVQEVIGQGGMGVVLKAFEPSLHRLVAIKVLSPALAGSATARLRFTREAKAAAAVCHDHIVVVHGVHETDGLPYLVMEYIAGESLQERIDRTGPLELIEIVRIGLQTASGLAAAHAQGLIHRDIKPANLLLENGLARVTITDFGLARTVDDVQLTQNGVVTGTPEYMAPEQARGDAIDHRADLFSLGSVLYAMSTGEPPFRGSTALAVLRHVSDETPAGVRTLNPEIPAWLETLIARLMAKDAADRFQSAAEVAALLEGYLAHLRQPATVAAPQLPCAPGAVHSGRSLMSPRLTPRTCLLAAAGIVCVLGVLAALGAGGLNSKDPVAVDPKPGRADLLPPKDAKPVEPKNGLVCLLVNKNSGRCLSIGAAANPGAKVVQGPMPEQAGAAERWTLLGAGDAFRLRNESSGLVLEMGGGNRNPGVQAIQWHDQLTVAHQQWSFEPVAEGYVLRAVHSQLVLGIREAAQDEGGRAVQWDYIPGALEECWELRRAYAEVELRDQLVRDFRGKPLPRDMVPFGPWLDEFAKVEPEGLRITLPNDRDSKDTVGFSQALAIGGDFEITLALEILQAQQPAPRSFGVGVLMSVNESAGRVGRLVRTHGAVVSWDRWATVNDKRVWQDGAAPCKGTMGRLRLARTRNILHFLWAPELAGDDFQDVYQCAFDADEVSLLRLELCSNVDGKNPGTLDVRLLDLKVRASKPAAVPAVEPVVPPGDEERPAQSIVWLVGAGTLGLGIVVAGLVSLLVRFRRRAPTPVSESSVAAQAKPAAFAFFGCSSCGKRLKTKAALAGKKIKCPQCGKAVVVPESTA